MDGQGAIIVGLITACSTFFIGYARLKRTVSQLKWRNGRLTPPSRLADLSTDNWRLMRKLNAFVALDREAIILDHCCRVGMFATGFLIVLGLVIGLIGYELGDQPVGFWTGKDLQDFGWGWLFILPTGWWMYVGGRGALAEYALAKLEED
jgi:hypothetical protein